MTPRSAILAVLRNGRPRHTGEIVERLREDHGIALSPSECAAALAWIPGVVGDGLVQTTGGSPTRVWRLTGGKA